MANGPAYYPLNELALGMRKVYRPIEYPTTPQAPTQSALTYTPGPVASRVINAQANWEQGVADIQRALTTAGAGDWRQEEQARLAEAERLRRRVPQEIIQQKEAVKWTPEGPQGFTPGGLATLVTESIATPATAAAIVGGFLTRSPKVATKIAGLGSAAAVNAAQTAGQSARSVEAQGGDIEAQKQAALGSAFVGAGEGVLDALVLNKLVGMAGLDKAAAKQSLTQLANAGNTAAQARLDLLLAEEAKLKAAPFATKAVNFLKEAGTTVAVGAGTEAIEEGFANAGQRVVENVALKKPTWEGVKEDALLGASIGAISGGIMSGGLHAATQAITKLAPETTPGAANTTGADQGFTGSEVPFTKAGLEATKNINLAVKANQGFAKAMDTAPIISSQETGVAPTTVEQHNARNASIETAQTATQDLSAAIGAEPVPQQAGQPTGFAKRPKVSEKIENILNQPVEAAPAKPAESPWAKFTPGRLDFQEATDTDISTFAKGLQSGEISPQDPFAVSFLQAYTPQVEEKLQAAKAAEEITIIAPPSGVTLPGTGRYTAKDQLKSDRANKFIGQGSAVSSTERYRSAWGDKANTGQYTAADTVFVSAEGNRRGRLAPNYDELRLAVNAGAEIITDDEVNRSRSYNVGEREVAEFLRNNGYEEQNKGGIWKKSREATLEEQATQEQRIEAVTDVPALEGRVPSPEERLSKFTTSNQYAIGVADTDEDRRMKRYEVGGLRVGLNTKGQHVIDSLTVGDIKVAIAQGNRELADAMLTQLEDSKNHEDTHRIISSRGERGEHVYIPEVQQIAQEAATDVDTNTWMRESAELLVHRKSYQDQFRSELNASLPPEAPKIPEGTILTTDDLMSTQEGRLALLNELLAGHPNAETKRSRVSDDIYARYLAGRQQRLSRIPNFPNRIINGPIPGRLSPELVSQLQEVRKSSDNLVKAEESIQAKLDEIAVDDPATVEHVRRTTELLRFVLDTFKDTPALAKLLTPEGILHLRLAAMGHDLGKAGMEDILHKETLTDAEVERIKEHAERSRIWLEENGVPAEIAQIAGEHHTKPSEQKNPLSKILQMIDFVDSVIGGPGSGHEYPLKLDEGPAPRTRQSVLTAIAQAKQRGSLDPAMADLAAELVSSGNLPTELEAQLQANEIAAPQISYSPEEVQGLMLDKDGIVTDAFRMIEEITQDETTPEYIWLAKSLPLVLTKAPFKSIVNEYLRRTNARAKLVAEDILGDKYLRRAAAFFLLKYEYENRKKLAKKDYSAYLEGRTGLINRLVTPTVTPTVTLDDIYATELLSGMKTEGMDSYYVDTKGDRAEVKGKVAKSRTINLTRLDSIVERAIQKMHTLLGHKAGIVKRENNTTYTVGDQTYNLESDDENGFRVVPAKGGYNENYDVTIENDGTEYRVRVDDFTIESGEPAREARAKNYIVQGQRSAYAILKHKTALGENIKGYTVAFKDGTYTTTSALRKAGAALSDRKNDSIANKYANLVEGFAQANSIHGEIAGTELNSLVVSDDDAYGKVTFTEAQRFVTGDADASAKAARRERAAKVLLGREFQKRKDINAVKELQAEWEAAKLGNPALNRTAWLEEIRSAAAKVAQEYTGEEFTGKVKESSVDVAEKAAESIKHLLTRVNPSSSIDQLVYLFNSLETKAGTDIAATEGRTIKARGSKVALHALPILRNLLAAKRANPSLNPHLWLREQLNLAEKEAQYASTREEDASIEEVSEDDAADALRAQATVGKTTPPSTREVGTSEIVNRAASTPSRVVSYLNGMLRTLRIPTAFTLYDSDSIVVTVEPKRPDIGRDYTEDDLTEKDKSLIRQQTADGLGIPPEQLDPLHNRNQAKELVANIYAFLYDINLSIADARQAAQPRANAMSPEVQAIVSERPYASQFIALDNAVAGREHVIYIATKNADGSPRSRADQAVDLAHEIGHFVQRVSMDAIVDSAVKSGNVNSMNIIGDLLGLTSDTNEEGDTRHPLLVYAGMSDVEKISIDEIFANRLAKEMLKANKILAVDGVTYADVIAENTTQGFFQRLASLLVKLYNSLKSVGSYAGNFEGYLRAMTGRERGELYDVVEAAGRSQIIRQRKTGRVQYQGLDPMARTSQFTKMLDSRLVQSVAKGITHWFGLDSELRSMKSKTATWLARTFSGATGDVMRKEFQDNFRKFVDFSWGSGVIRETVEGGKEYGLGLKYSAVLNNLPVYNKTLFGFSIKSTPQGNAFMEAVHRYGSMQSPLEAIPADLNFVVEETVGGRKNVTLNVRDTIAAIRQYYTRDLYNYQTAEGMPLKKIQNYWPFEITRETAMQFEAEIRAELKKDLVNMPVWVRTPDGRDILEYHSEKGKSKQWIDDFINSFKYGVAVDRDPFQGESDAEVMRKKSIAAMGKVGILGGNIAGTTNNATKAREMSDARRLSLMNFSEADVSSMVMRRTGEAIKSRAADHMWGSWVVVGGRGGTEGKYDFTLMNREDYRVWVLEQVIALKDSIMQLYGRPDLTDRAINEAKLNGAFPAQIREMIEMRKRIYKMAMDPESTSAEGLRAKEMKATMDAALDRNYYSTFAKVDAALAQGEVSGDIDMGDVIRIQDVLLPAMLGRLGQRDITSAWRAAQAYIMTGMNVMYLPLMVLSAVAELPQIGIRMYDPILGNGMFKSQAAMLKGVGEMLFNADGTQRKEAEDVLSAIGMIKDSAIESAITTSTEGEFLPVRVKQFNQKFFEWTLIKRFTEFERMVAYKIGKQALMQYAQRARAGGPDAAQAQAQADAIGLDVDAALQYMGNEAEWIKTKNFQDAIYNWVDEANLRPGPNTRPARMSDPRFAVVWYLKDFSWAMQARTLTYLVQQSKLQPGVIAQLTPWLAAAVPMMIAGGLGAYTRDLLTNQAPAALLGVKPYDRYKHASDVVSAAVTRSGMLGPMELLYTFGENYKHRGLPWVSLLSPLASLTQEAALTGSINTAKRHIPLIAMASPPVKKAMLSALGLGPGYAQ